MNGYILVGIIDQSIHTVSNRFEEFFLDLSAKRNQLTNPTLSSTVFPINTKRLTEKIKYVVTFPLIKAPLQLQYSKTLNPQKHPT